ncbi:MAG: hypothetical protein OXI15_20920, partial [Chromatiales bacterium]|nr:hypothetical protein [Chromatiales bacterium]
MLIAPSGGVRTRCPIRISAYLRVSAQALIHDKRSMDSTCRVPVPKGRTRSSGAVAKRPAVPSALASHPPEFSACRQRLFRSRARRSQVDYRSPMTRASFGTA